MTGEQHNTDLPGVLPTDEEVVRVGINRTANLADAAMAWARAAVIPGEYEKTLLSAWLWAIDRAATDLALWEQVEVARGLLDLCVPFDESRAMRYTDPVSERRPT